MPREKEYRAKPKRVHKMTRDGLVEVDKVTGREKLVNQQGDGPNEQGEGLRDYRMQYDRTHTGVESHQPIAQAQRPSDRRSHRRQSYTHDRPFQQDIENQHPHENDTYTSQNSDNTNIDDPIDFRSKARDNHAGFQTEENNIQQSWQQQPLPEGPQSSKARSRKAMRRHFDAEHQVEEFSANDQSSIYSTIHDERGEDATYWSSDEQDEQSDENDANDNDTHSRLQQDDARPNGDTKSTKPNQHKTKYSQRFVPQHEQQYGHPVNNEKAENQQTTKCQKKASVEQDSGSRDDGWKRERNEKASTGKRDTLKKKAASKLKFNPDEVPPEHGDTQPVPSDKKLDKAKKKAEKYDSKLDKAEGKLPTHKRLRFDKEFDADAGKPKRHLHVEQEVKTPKQHLKGPLIKRPPKALVKKGVHELHKEITSVEHENVGVEAAHKGEKVLERGIRGAYRSAKLHPYKKVDKLRRRKAKWNAKSAYQQALHDNPQLSKSVVARYKQRRMMKKQHAKETRKAKKTATRAGESKNVVVRTGQRAASFVRRHPVMMKFIAILLFLVLIASGLVSSCSNMSESSLSAVVASSYLAEDTDIDDAELYYTEWEADLLLRAQNAEKEFPGYDEYRYQIDEMGHSPFELMAFLTAVYQDFTYAEIQAILFEIFEEQYQLEFVPEVEIRYRTVTRYDGDGNAYTIEEPYEWHILNVILTTNSFMDIISPRMDADQRELFDVLMETKGNRQYLYNIFEFNWLPYVAEFYGYSVSNGAKVFHNGVDIVVPVGSNILAGFDGTITSSGGTVVLEGEEGVVARYVGCTGAVGTGEVKKGDVIAKVGSGGSCWGLHLEVIKDGRHLNPIYFAETGDDGNSDVPPGQPEGPSIPPNPGGAMGDGSYEALIAEAEKYLGYPYVWGGSNPKQSFDCSGYVCWVLNKSGVKNVGRTTAQGIYGYCTPVSRAEARPGDIIFFQGTYKPGDGRVITHVGIYVGNGMMIHCAGNGVEYHSIDSPYYRKHFYAFGRLK